MSNNLSEIPNNFYIGQKYIEDSSRINVIIEVYFYSPAVLKEFEFRIDNKKIVVNHSGSLLKVEFEEKISNKLFNDIKKEQEGPFIIGYISKVLPKLNYEMLKCRHTDGHFLIKTFSTTDIEKIVLERKDTGEKVFPRLVGSITSFPPSKVHAPDFEKFVFIRDLIDAGNLYFYYNYDDCIRKIITSAENCFRHYKLKGNRRFLFFRNNSFISKVKHNIYGETLSREVLSHNLIFIYKIRNKIVHDKLRIHYDNGWFCKKALGTLFYIYQFLSKEKNMKDYIFSLQMQFLALNDFTFGTNLSDLERAVRREEKATEAEIEKRTIRTPQQLDKFMFESLKITKSEQKRILKGCS